MRGAHHAFEIKASFLITPANFGSGAGSCAPLIVVVALGEPGTPEVSTACAKNECVASSIATKAGSIKFGFIICSFLF
jgi:hypothetical protein